MGWGIGTGEGGRDIGYMVPATCDQPRCKKRIDRGLGYVCGGQPYGGEDGCGLFFCEKHLEYASGPNDNGNLQHSPQLCDRCAYNFDIGPERWEEYKPAYNPKPDLILWVLWKLNEPSWAKWRKENPKEVFKMHKRVLRYVERELA